MRSAHRQLIRWTCIVILACVLTALAGVFGFAVYTCSAAGHPFACTVNFFYAHLYALAGAPFTHLPLVALTMMLLSPLIAVAFTTALIFFLVYVIKRI